MPSQRSPNFPAFRTATVSPGEATFTSAASSPALPLAVRVSTGWRVPKSRMSPAVARASTVWNSEVRWCNAGRARISRTDSGRGVGPGVYRRSSLTATT